MQSKPRNTHQKTIFKVQTLEFMTILYKTNVSYYNYNLYTITDKRFYTHSKSETKAETWTTSLPT